MINLHRITGKDIGVFANESLPLDKNSVSVIRGKNLDVKGKVKRGADSANRVGKSLIMSLIPTLRFYAPPTATRKKSAKDLHSGASAITLEFTKGKSRYAISQYNKGKSIKLDITKDGKLLKYREQAAAQRKMASLLPQTEAQFYALTYIDVRRNNPLQRGTDAERFQFFEDIFELDIYDRIAKELNSEYNTLKYKVAQLNAFRSEYHERKQDLPKKDFRELQTEYKSIRENTKQIRQKVENGLRSLEQLSIYMTLAKGLDPSIKRKDVVTKLKELRSDADFLAQRYRDAVEFRSKKEQYESTVKRRKELKRRLKVIEDLGITATLKELQAKLKELTTKIFNANAEIGKASELNERIADANDEIQTVLSDSKLPKKWINRATQVTSKQIENSISIEKGTIKQNEEIIEFLKHHEHSDASSCPVCNTKLSGKAIDGIVLRCQDAIGNARKQLKLLRAVHAYRINYEKLAALGTKQDIKRLTTKREKLEQEALAVEKQIKALGFKTKYETLLKELKLPKFNIKQKEADPLVFERTLEEVREQITAFETYLEKLDNLAQLETTYASYAAAKAEYSKVQAYINKYKPILDKSQDKLNSINESISKHEIVTKDLIRLKKKIGEHAKVEDDFKIYDALKKAYSARGMRKIRIRELAKAMETNMNDFAHLIFAEPIKFTFNVTDTKFDVLATRNNGKTSDVRMLSNSESRAFVLLLFLAMIPFIPAQNRFNILVMDEIEAG